MGCCSGDREKLIRNDVKWEYVNFNDFKVQSCWTAFAYIWLWMMLFVSISVYAVDTFTAINLLAFNKWSGQIKPFVDLRYSRWIFAGCIILSFILLAYRWIRALKVMRGGTVAKSYLDPLAVRVQSIRMGSKGKGWKRFLVFAELTKSRKGADYVALFAYYSFEAWLRICFAEGPRQVINGMTLYSVMNAELIPHADTEGRSSILVFWLNVGAMAEKNKLSAVILFGMLWTVFIWVISALSLAISVILYLIFLWHHIPSGSGGLTGYCRSKINRRMERIVKVKTDKALKKENEIRARQEERAFRDGFNDVKRQPTLPDLGTPTSSLPPLSRQTTMTTLPEYQSRPGTARTSSDTLPPMPTPIDTHRPVPRRHMTNASDASWSSYNSNAPLMSSAGDMGHSPADRIQTPPSAVSTPWSARPGGPHRGFPSTSEFSDRSMTPGPPRPNTAQSGRHTPGTYQMESLSRPGTSMSNNSHWRGRMSTDSDTLPPPVPRYQTPVSGFPPSGPSTAPMMPDNHARRTPAPAHNPYFPPISPIPEYGGRDSPASSVYSQHAPPPRSFTPGGPPPRTMTPGSQMPPQSRSQTPNTMGNNSGYVPFNPNRDQLLTPHSAGSRWDRPPPPERGGSVEDIINHY